MIILARENSTQAGVTNAKFLHGHIEDIPLPDGHVDVVISNCVINLSADKPSVLAETFRVLRPGGRLGISDVIADDGLDPAQRAEAEQRTGCTTGTVTAAGYRALLLASGFTSIQITATQDTEPGLRSAIIQAARPAAPPGILIRPMRPCDADQVLAIYQAGLDNGDASFETTAPAWDAFDHGKLSLHRHVAAAVTGEVLGWIAASAVSPRPVYRGVIEHSIYVHPDARGQGIGAALLDAFTGSTEADRNLDHPDRNLPRKHPQPPTPPASRIPPRRHPPAHRPSSRPLARRHHPRTPQHRRWNLIPPAPARSP